jgi:hypothetical protein
MNMDKDTAWSMFEKTGNIDMYLLYHDITGRDDKLRYQEDLLNADQNRRPDNSGFERR